MWSTTKLLLLFTLTFYTLSSSSLSVRLAVIYCPPPGGLAASPLLRVVDVALPTGALSLVGFVPLFFPDGSLPQCPEPPDQFVPPDFIAGNNASDILFGFYQSKQLLRLSLESGLFTSYPLSLGFDFEDAILIKDTLRGMTNAWYKTNPNCTNGCFAWASADLSTGTITPPSEDTIIGIQETMGGSMYPATEPSQVWFQGGIGATPAWRCLDGWCNFRVNVETGTLLETVSVLPKQVATHCYAPNTGPSPLAFVEDLDCGGGQQGFHDWGLARINFESGNHTTVACFPPQIITQAPDICGFSDDGSLLAQAAPWWFTDGPLHLTVLTSTGELVLESNLSALPDLLHPGLNASLISISAVGFSNL
jgi:hypothetical protein